MSRSKKKTKIHGITTAVSEKKNKRKANRKFRRMIRERLKSKGENLPALREVSNVWDFDKDGKIYKKNIPAKLMRK